MYMTNKEENSTTEEIFDQALIGLSRVGIPLQSDELRSDSVIPKSASPSQNRPEEFREALMDQILAKHPGLTREKLSAQMEAMGF
jgi:hypothetical protein